MKRNHFTPYSVLDELMASDSQPLPAEKRTYQLMRMRQGLDDLMHAAMPSADSWRGCDGAPVEVRDSSGLLLDAITALAHAGDRSLQGKPMRLDGPGLSAVRSVPEDYQAALECLPARTMIRCHRKTAARMRKVLSRISQLPDGVHVMAI